MLGTLRRRLLQEGQAPAIGMARPPVTERIVPARKTPTLRAGNA